MDSTIISRGGDEMAIEEKEKKEDVKPEKKAKSYGKARKGIYFGPSLGFEGTEAYKLLRTNLKFAVPAEKECKVVGVTSSLRAALDSQGRLEDYWTAQLLSGGPLAGPESLIEPVERVTVEDVARVARAVELDTVYQLAGREDV